MSNQIKREIDSALVPIYLREAGRLLEREGNSTLLHKLLAAETEQGINIVYDWARNNGEEGAFIRFVEDAWSTADNDLKNAKTVADRQRSINLQLRYVLIRSSVVSALGELPQESMAQLAERGRRIQGFERVRQIASENERMAALFKLVDEIMDEFDPTQVDDLDEALGRVWEETWTTIKDFQSDLNRAQCIAKLVSYAPRSRIEEILEYVIKDVPAIGSMSGSPLQLALEGLAPRLPSDLLLRAKEQILDGHRTWPGATGYDAIVRDLAVNLARSGEYSTLIDLMQAFDRRENMAATAAMLRGLLPEPILDVIWGHTRDEIGVRNTDESINARIELAPIFNTHEVDLLLSHIQTVDNPEYRSDLLFRLAPKLQGLERVKILEILDRTCRTVLKHASTERRLANKTIELIPCLQEEEARILLGFFGEMTDREEQERIVEALRQHLEPDSLSENQFEASTDDSEPLLGSAPIKDAAEWVVAMSEATLRFPESFDDGDFMNCVLAAARKNLEGGEYDFYVGHLLSESIRRGGEAESIRILKQINSEDSSPFLSDALICMARAGHPLQAFVLAIELASVEWRIRTLIRLIHQFPDQLRDEVAELAYRMTVEKQPKGRHTLLAELSSVEIESPSLAAEISRCVLEDLTVDRVTPDVWNFLLRRHRDVTVSFLSQELDTIHGKYWSGYERVERLQKVAPYVSENLLERAVELARDLPHNDQLLMTLSRRLKEEGKVSLAFDIAKSHKEPETRVHLLYSIYPQLSSEQRTESCRIFEAAVTPISERSGKTYAIALAEAADLLGNEDLYSVALGCCKTWFPEEHVETLLAMLPLLPESRRSEVLKLAFSTFFTIADTPTFYLKRLKGQLATAFTQLPSHESLSLWRESLHSHGTRPRVEILQHMDLWLSLGTHLAGGNISVEVAGTIQDIGRWWFPASERNQQEAQHTLQEVLGKRCLNSWGFG